MNGRRNGAQKKKPDAHYTFVCPTHRLESREPLTPSIPGGGGRIPLGPPEIGEHLCPVHQFPVAGRLFPATTGFPSPPVPPPPASGPCLLRGRGGVLRTLAAASFDPAFLKCDAIFRRFHHGSTHCRSSRIHPSLLVSVPGGFIRIP